MSDREEIKRGEEPPIYEMNQKELLKFVQDGSPDDRVLANTELQIRLIKELARLTTELKKANLVAGSLDKNFTSTLDGLRNDLNKLREEISSVQESVSKSGEMMSSTLESSNKYLVVQAKAAKALAFFAFVQLIVIIIRIVFHV